jgi:hypothetical protein
VHGERGAATLGDGGPRSVVAVMAAGGLRWLGRDGARPSMGRDATERVPPDRTCGAALDDERTRVWQRPFGDYGAAHG